MNLNPEQRIAVNHINGPCLAVACPGSGKTKVLTERVINLLNQGVDPNKLLCLTFTNKAAGEMKERIYNRTGEMAKKIYIGTFHSLCVAILRKYGSRVGLTPSFSIYDDKDQFDLLQKIGRMHDVEIKLEDAKRLARALNDFREDVGVNTSLSGQSVGESIVLQEYPKIIDEFNAVDFSGLLFKTYTLLQNNPDIVSALSSRFQYISVDETQDTNRIQYEIVRLLGNHGNIFMVGDPDQCVFEDEMLTVKLGDEIKDLQAKYLPPSGKILSWRNKPVWQDFVSQPSSATNGFRFTLENYGTLSVSYNHKVYIRRPEIPKNHSLVYMMYRPDLGFRVGVTNTSDIGYGRRTSSESALKMWILGIFNNREDALLEEERICLQYGVPTAIFEGQARGLNQDRINKIFAQFGQNGFKVLNDYQLDFNYPLWSTRSRDRTNWDVNRINLCAHGAKGLSQVSYEWSDESFNNIISNLGFHVTLSKKRRDGRPRYRVRKYFNDYSKAVSLANKLAERLDAFIIEQLYVKNWCVILTTASAVRVGCYIPVLNKDGELSLDKVVNIEPITGKFISIEVDSSQVFFNSNKILSHNSIFSWRGAKPENLESFKKDFQNVKIVTLPRNYRSKKKILDIAQSLIRHNPDREQVVLKSERGEGGSVSINAYNGPDIEAAQVARTIRNLRINKGLKWSDFAVLYRINSLSQPIEVAFRKENIPYKIVGGFSFFDRKEIKTSMAYLSLFSNFSDTIAFARVVQNPKRGVGETVIGSIEKYCKDNKVNLFDAIKNSSVKLSNKQKEELNKIVNVFEKYKSKEKELNPQEITNGLLKECGYLAYIEKTSQEDQDYEKRKDNVDQFIASVGDFISDRPNATISDFLQNVSLLSEDMLNKEENDNAVMLSTIHSAKGLEWECVFVVGVEDGKIPHYMNESGDRLEEERRLLYVAITRSCNQLFISYCEHRNNYGLKISKINKCKYSRFLDEIHGK